MSDPKTSLQIYNAARARIASKFSDPRQQQLALQRFDSDPRVQQVRKLAGLAPLSTTKGEVKAVAKQALSAPVQALDDVARLVANGATFGFADKIARSMGEKDTTEKTKAASDRAGIVAPIADLVGGYLTMRGFGTAASALAKAGTPAIARVGNILQELGTFRKGQKAANVGKLAAIGGATGGAQAAGTDQDILSGVAEGAVAAPLIAGAAKVIIPGLARAGQVLAAPFSDFLKLPNASRVLSKITSATTDQIEREWQNLKAINPNAKPTLFELLPLADRNKIMNQVASKNDNVAEQTGQAITKRAKQLAPEMQARINQILQPNRHAVQQKLLADLTAARGGELKPGDAEIAKKAINSTTDMDAFRKLEADAHMEPHNNKTVGSLHDIMPSAPVPGKPVDTRGAGTFYHGARGPIDGLSDGYYSPNNIYGGDGTLYTTDAYDIAKGYGRKQPASTVYQTAEKTPVKTFNMEQPLTSDRVDHLFGNDDLAGLAYENLVHEGNKTPNLREVMDEMRRSSASEGLSKNDTQEIFSAAITNLQKEGYGGMTHTGGLLTGRDPHTVRIYFDPAKQLKMSEAAPMNEPGARIELDPELSNAIRSVAGTARGVPDKPLEVSRVVDMIHSLKKPSAVLDPNVAADAEAHLQNVLRNVDPEVAKAAQRMNDAYAGRSRTLEGMSAGSSTQLRDTIDTGTKAGSSRLVRNAYDTPEGTAGRELGQGNLILSDLGGGPGPALRLANDITGTNRDIGRELEQNLGSAASRVTAVAEDTAKSGQALGSALNKINGGADNSTTPLQALIQTAAALHPTSFASTKAKGVAKLTGWLGIPENRARTIVDMVFSSDPAMQQKAINALGNESNGSQFIKYLSGITGKGIVAGLAPLSGSAEAPEVSQGPNTPPITELDPAIGTETPADPYASIADQAAPDEAAPAVTGPDPYGDIAAPADPNAKISPYAAKLTETYANENPDLVALVQRQKQQESSGNQAAVSKKGAVGVMQVMPDTGPIAAKLAGVPWDPKAWKNDPAYNELLGHAYQASLLRKYGGDVSKALAAYNAGPGNVDKALASHGDQFLTALPPETQNYVSRVGGQ